MRDAQTFQIELRIEDKILCEVGSEQLVILSLENIERDSVATLFDVVNDLFKLGEHCLAKKCAANVVDLTVDDVSAHFRVPRLLEQVMSQQFFVKGRRDFG